MQKRKQITAKLKHDIVFLWLTKGGFLRRMGKKYPEFFMKHFVKDLTDSRAEQKVMELRYTGEYKMKFEAIGFMLGITERYVYELHKNVIERIISA